MPFMRFSDLEGRTEIIESLQKSLIEDKIAHSYMFIGPSGIGKKTLGKLFAKGILCRSQDKRPCAVCKYCIQFDTGNHPDVVIVKPETSTISVDIIRAINKDITLQPYQAGKKIVLIESAHLMTVQAQNALLKSIEEPPIHVIFILFADQTNKILPTIRSRCRIVRLHSLTKQEVSKILVKRTDVSPALALSCALLSEGNPGKAIEIATSESYARDRLRVSVILDHDNYSVSTMFKDIIETLSASRDEAVQFIEIFALWVRDLLILNETGNEDFVFNFDFIQNLRNQCAIYSFDELNSILIKLTNAKKLIDEKVNLRLILDDLIICFSERRLYADNYRGKI